MCLVRAEIINKIEMIKIKSDTQQDNKTVSKKRHPTSIRFEQAILIMHTEPLPIPADVWLQ